MTIMPGVMRRIQYLVGAFLGFLFLWVLLNQPRVANAASLPPNFSETVLADALSHPTAFALAPDGRIFVAELDGTVRVIKNNALLDAPFVSLTVDRRGEHGLLGIALDPAFSQNGFIYLYYTAPIVSLATTNSNVVQRFTAAGDVALANSAVTIFELEALNQTDFRHDGGAIHFGVDEKLYIATGDNTTPANAQSLNSLHGKLLRINADGSIPNDNPYYLTSTNQYRAIWAMGFRNPFTFAIQPGTNQTFVNDVGENSFEEINQVQVAGNYGWNLCEGPCNPANPNYLDPIFYYNHENPYTNTSGCSIAGGAFYTPSTLTFPTEYAGDYFFSDWCSGWIRKLDASTSQVTLFATNLPHPIDLAVGNDGALYYLYYGANYGAQPGGVSKIQSTLPPPDTATPTTPQTASRTPSPTTTQTRTITRTATSSSTWTRTLNSTATPTHTSTQSATFTPTRTAQPTWTWTSTQSPTLPSVTITPSATSVSCATKPTIPVLLAPRENQKVKTRVVFMDWTDVACATRYRVVVRLGAPKGDIVFRRRGLVESEVTTNVLQPDAKFYWRAYACNEHGCSHSAWRKFRIRANAKDNE